MKIQLPPERVWFTSDIHGYHKNLCKGTSTWPTGGQRDFPDEISMTKKICENINSKVGKDDILIHLGDWSFGSKDNVGKLRGMINCEKVIGLSGNHDYNIIKNPELQKYFYKWYGDIDTSPIVTFHIGGKTYICSHYCLKVYENSHKGWRHAYGHSHSTLIDCPHTFSRDVGLDNNNLFPISVVEFEEYMLTKEYKECDHHRPENPN